MKVTKKTILMDDESKRIDVENISDFIMENINRFVAVIEIKRPILSKD